MNCTWIIPMDNGRKINGYQVQWRRPKDRYGENSLFVEAQQGRKWARELLLPQKEYDDDEDHLVS